MAAKPDGKPWTIREQIVEDLASGLTLQFEIVLGDVSAPIRLRIFGDALPFGNREILFNSEGQEVGGGTFTSAICRSAWLERLEGQDNAAENNHNLR